MQRSASGQKFLQGSEQVPGHAELVVAEMDIIAVDPTVTTPRDGVKDLA